MKKIILVVAVMAFTTVHAQIITSYGRRSCGVWIAVISKTDPREMLDARGWLVGYLSGIAIERRKDILAGTDAESMFLWMDNYCRENPLSNTVDGGIYLAAELEAKME